MLQGLDVYYLNDLHVPILYSRGFINIFSRSATGLSRGFINIFSRSATGVLRQAKLFELNFILRKTFLYL